MEIILGRLIINHIERDPTANQSINFHRVSISSGVIGTICHLTGVHQHPIDMQSCISHWTNTSYSASSSPSPPLLLAEEIKERVLIGEMDSVGVFIQILASFCRLFESNRLDFCALIMQHLSTPRPPPPLDPSPYLRELSVYHLSTFVLYGFIIQERWPLSTVYSSIDW